MIYIYKISFINMYKRNKMLLLKQAKNIYNFLMNLLNLELSKSINLVFKDDCF